MREDVSIQATGLGPRLETDGTARFADVLRAGLFLHTLVARERVTHDRDCTRKDTSTERITVLDYRSRGTLSPPHTNTAYTRLFRTCRGYRRRATHQSGSMAVATWRARVGPDSRLDWARTGIWQWSERVPCAGDLALITYCLDWRNTLRSTRVRLRTSTRSRSTSHRGLTFCLSDHHPPDRRCVLRA